MKDMHWMTMIYYYFCGRNYVPPSDEILNLIIREAHRAFYMAYQRVNKMNAYMKALFFWNGMKFKVPDLLCRVET
jgi:hypothetical protein